MIKKFKMEDVDCADCAAKMEKKIKKLDGVSHTPSSLYYQKNLFKSKKSVFVDALTSDIFDHISDSFEILEFLVLNLYTVLILKGHNELHKLK